MSLSGNQVIDQSTQNAVISKRQQKKFEQVLRQIAASENPDAKSHKKRRNPTQRKSDPQARKLIKVPYPSMQTQSHQSDAKNKEGSSSVRQLSEDDSRKSEGFSEYMVNYTYGEKSKYVEKQCEDWSVLDNLCGKQIETTSQIKDQQLCQSINTKLSEQKDKVRQLFTKDNKDFMRKILQQLLP